MQQSPEAIIVLAAVVVAVTEEVPRVPVVRRVTHALAPPVPAGHGIETADSVETLPFGPFDPGQHRTLELGLRRWVEEQTGLPLRYVEQLYTFGNRYRDWREMRGGPRVVTVGYIALTPETPLAGSGEAHWRDWYGFLPWEDWRDGRPAIVDQVIQPTLEAWAAAAGSSAQRHARRERIAITMGLGESGWDIERTLERYELLYETGLVVEALRDRLSLDLSGGSGAPAIDSAQLELAKRLGAPMALDNRRILATALGRLRGKVRYRPVVFDLLPATFTLLQLQKVVEALSGVRLHKQNFRRLVLNGGLVEPTGESEIQARGRPAGLFRFRREVLRERVAPGVGVPAVPVQP